VRDDDLLPFSFSAVDRKIVNAAFNGGRITSDGVVMIADMIRTRIFASPAARREPIR
jgi:hypothetical protein